VSIFVEGHPVRRELEETKGVRQWQPLGGGGFSEVWHVVVDGAHVALKLSKQPVDTENAVLRELKVFELPMVRQHPLIVSYFGSWEVQGYLATRWELGAGTLETLLEDHQKNRGNGLPRDVLTGDDGYPPGYMWQIASVLDYLWSPGKDTGVRHSDIKPANLVLFSGGYVKLGDLGLAKVVRPPADSTDSFLIGGALGYMPPECFQGQQHPTWDVYSLAATYVRLRSGKEPFGDDREKVVERQRECQFVDDGLDPDEREPLRRALAVDPAKRPRQGARAFVQSLRVQRTAVSVSIREPEGKLEEQMVVVPAGEFEMGSPVDEPGRGAHEGQHRVRLARPFSVGVCPVTVTQFEEFARARPTFKTEAERCGDGYVWRKGRWVLTPAATWRHPGFRQEPDCPVVLVSWNDCQAFCEWLSDRTGDEYRLLTEAEWEYVCRGDAKSYQVFGTGTGQWLSSHQANFDGRAPYGLRIPGPMLGQTCEVGKYDLTGWGVKDMLGNVWEWCRDYFAEDYYGVSPADDPLGPDKGVTRVLRGGGWEATGAQCRSACRHHAAPSDRFNSVGFRVMKVIK